MPKRRKGNDKLVDMDKPTKLEEAIAKYLRFNCPSKEGKLRGMTVSYFIASDAVDYLLKSKWSVEHAKNKDDVVFSNRSSAVSFMDGLLRKGMFHRAAKVMKKLKKEKAMESAENETSSLKRRKETKGKRTSKEKEPEQTGAMDKDSEKDKEETAKKRKRKLDMHADQRFVDGNELYVWIFDPTPWYKTVIGLLMCLGCIMFCVYPLWPTELRHSFGYLFYVLAGLLGLLLAILVVRGIIFGLTWAVSMGTIYFWLFPNLNEDCGVLESFQPLYSLERCADNKGAGKEEPEENEEEEEEEEEENVKPVADQDHSDSGSASSKNDFEMVDSTNGKDSKN